MKKIIAIIGLLLLMVGVAQADYIDCSGLPKTHTITVNIKLASDGSSIISGGATTEREGTADSNYYYNFTGETAGSTYVVECLDATDATNDFSWTLSGRETFVNASVSSRSTYAGGAVASVTGAVGSVGSSVTCGTVSDKTGYVLTSSYDAAKTAATQTSVNAIPTNPTLQTTWTDAKAGYLTGAVALQGSVDDLEGRLTATRAGYLDNLSGGAVALNSTVAKEATLANATYGLSALKDLIDAIDTSTELQARFTEIKGASWTTETLKVIKDTLASGVTVSSNTDKTGYVLSAAGVGAIHDEVIEGTLTARQLSRVLLAVLAGKSSGGGTTIILFKGKDGTTTRVTAYVDSNGNRTSVTINGE